MYPCMKGKQSPQHLLRAPGYTLLEGGPTLLVTVPLFSNNETEPIKVCKIISRLCKQAIHTSKLSNNDLTDSSIRLPETNELEYLISSDSPVSNSHSSSFMISYSGHMVLLATVHI